MIGSEFRFACISRFLLFGYIPLLKVYFFCDIPFESFVNVLTCFLFENVTCYVEVPIVIYKISAWFFTAAFRKQPFISTRITCRMEYTGFRPEDIYYFSFFFNL